MASTQGINAIRSLWSTQGINAIRSLWPSDCMQQSIACNNHDITLIKGISLHKHRYQHAKVVQTSEDLSILS